MLSSRWIFWIVTGVVVLSVFLAIVSNRQDMTELLYPRKDYSQDVSTMYHGLGRWQMKRKEFKRAIATFQYALQEAPDNLELYDDLGKAYERAGDKGKAFKTYIRAFARNELFSTVRFECMPDGELVDQQSDFDIKSCEEWRGQVMPEVSLFVYTPQSDADTIMLLRFIPDLCRKVGYVVLITKPSLVRLCRSLCPAPSNLEIVDGSISSWVVPQCSRHVALTQVPAFLNCTYDKVPRRACYLRPDYDALARFKNIFSSEKKIFKVGIALSTIKCLYPHAYTLCSCLLDGIWRNKQIYVYALPYIGGGENISSFESMLFQKIDEFTKEKRWIDLKDMCHDWSDVAACIAHCDIVIGLDNPIVHLAGALGKKVILILPEVASWHWMGFSEKTSSVWYKSLTKFHKDGSCSWAEVVENALEGVLVR